MPVLANNSGMLDAVMNRLRIPTSNVTERAKIQGVANDVYGDICSKQDWWWLQRRVVINTMPKIDTGTVSVTQNSASITFSTAPQQFSSNVSIIGYVLVLPGNSTDANAVYRVITHTSGLTTATLDAAYTGTTDTAASFKLYQVSYDLPTDCAKLVMVKRFGYRAPIERIGIEELSFLQMNNQQEGKPQVYSIFDFATNGSVSTARELQVFPYPDLAYRLECWYKHAQNNNTSTDLDLPIDYQQALTYGTLARCFAVFVNDLERSTFFQNLFNDVMALMSAQQREYAQSHPGVSTDMRGYRMGSIRNRWPGRSLGRYFDTLPNIP